MVSFVAFSKIYIAGLSAIRSQARSRFSFCNSCVN